MKPSVRRIFDILACPLTWITVALATIVMGGYILILYRLLPEKIGGRFLRKTALQWATILIWANLGRCRTLHKERTIPNPAIYVSNHESLVDIPMLMLSLPYGFKFLARKEIFSVPVLGHAMKNLGYIPVDRENRTRGIESIRQAGRLLIEKKTCVWIAPEGTRNFDGKMLPFKKGPFYLAMESKIPVVPVWLEGTHEMLPKKSIVLPLRSKVNCYIGSPYTRHITEDVTIEQVMEDVRAILLRMEKECLELVPDPRLPSYAAIGTRHVYLEDYIK